MPTLSNVVEIVCQGTLAETSFTKNIYNVFHYRLLTGTLDTMANIEGAFVLAVYDYWLTNMATTDYNFVGTNTRLLDDATAQYVFVASGTPGSVALPRLTGDLAVVTPFRCATRGKNFRGSKHFTPIATAHVTKDELNATGLTPWNTFTPKMLAPLTTSNGSTMGPCVVSRVLSQLRTNPTSIIGSDITSVLLNKTIGTMRRRKEKTIR